VTNTLAYYTKKYSAAAESFNLGHKRLSSGQWQKHSRYSTEGSKSGASTIKLFTLVIYFESLSVCYCQ
jgi:hypothetical protein